MLTTVLQSGFVEDWRVALDAYAAQRGPTALDGVEVEFDDLGRVAAIRSRRA